MLGVISLWVSNLPPISFYSKKKKKTLFFVFKISLIMKIRPQHLLISLSLLKSSVCFMYINKHQIQIVIDVCKKCCNLLSSIRYGLITPVTQ